MRLRELKHDQVDLIISHDNLGHQINSKENNEGLASLRGAAPVPPTTDKLLGGLHHPQQHLHLRPPEKRYDAIPQPLFNLNVLDHRDLLNFVVYERFLFREGHR